MFHHLIIHIFSLKCLYSCTHKLHYTFNFTTNSLLEIYSLNNAIVMFSVYRIWQNFKQLMEWVRTSVNIWLKYANICFDVQTSLQRKLQVYECPIFASYWGWINIGFIFKLSIYKLHVHRQYCSLLQWKMSSIMCKFNNGYSCVFRNSILSVYCDTCLAVRCC